MTAYSTEISRVNNLSEDKGNIKEDEKHCFMNDLTERFKIECEIEDSPKSEPDLNLDDQKRHKIKLFKTHSMNVNLSSKIKSENNDVKVNRNSVINNLKFSQRNIERKKINEVPLRLMDSCEILKQMKTQRRDYTENLDSFNNLVIVDVQELEEDKNEEDHNA